MALLVGLTTQRADLQTILWSVVVAGLPNTYGAVVRKTILRLAGCVAGGLAALAAMLIVSQNFDSLPPYLVAIFAVTMVSTYVAQSSEWLGYAGIQTGITFLICYVGPAPSSDIYKPLWRFWGIVLGVLTTGFVFLFLWPEYASDKVIESLDKLMRTTLAFGKEVAEGRITEETNRGRGAALEREFVSGSQHGRPGQTRGAPRLSEFRGRDRGGSYRHSNRVSFRNHRARATCGIGSGSTTRCAGALRRAGTGILCRIGIATRKMRVHWRGRRVRCIVRSRTTVGSRSDARDPGVGDWRNI